jgi:hypothetical protein
MVDLPKKNDPLERDAPRDATRNVFPGDGFFSSPSGHEAFFAFNAMPSRSLLALPRNPSGESPPEETLFGAP